MKSTRKKPNWQKVGSQSLLKELNAILAKSQPKGKGAGVECVIEKLLGGTDCSCQPSRKRKLEIKIRSVRPKKPAKK